jgi:hypothetical protein
MASAARDRACDRLESGPTVPKGTYGANSDMDSVPACRQLTTCGGVPASLGQALQAKPPRPSAGRDRDLCLCPVSTGEASL